MDIFCFIERDDGGREIIACAMTADGVILMRVKCDIELAPYLLGINNPRAVAHSVYRKNLNARYRLEWVSEPIKHRGVSKAYEENSRKSIQRASKTKSESLV